MSGLAQVGRYVLIGQSACRLLVFVLEAIDNTHNHNYNSHNNPQHYVLTTFLAIMNALPVLQRVEDNVTSVFQKACIIRAHYYKINVEALHYN